MTPKTPDRILITSALPYVNNLPHLGTLVCVVSADVYARYLRSRGKNALYILGTDEHGTTAEQKAREEGVTPRQLVNKYFKKHSEMYDWFEIKPDCYGRTSSKENHKITTEIYHRLAENGFIRKQTVAQAYDEKEKSFLADRFVEGTCPHCGYEDARGDQCDGCSKLLNPEELKKPRSKLGTGKVVFKESDHLFIDLPKLTPFITSWVKEASPTWSKNAQATTKGMLKEGLKPRAITRDLTWGVPVPDFPNKVFYSWFDAPIGYIGITAEHKQDWKDWWQDKNTELVQFMGKDNIVFHTILFPAFLLGTRQDWSLVKKLSVNEYLNYESGKFSKSRGVGVFADDAQATGIPADVWRYYLMINRPENADTEFSWDDFQEKLNKELVGNIGNLVNRTLSFIHQFAQGTLTVPGKDIGQHAQIKKIESLFDRIELKAALKAIMQVSTLGNQYFQQEAPWTKKGDAALDQILANLALFVKDLSILIYPFLPQTASKMQALLGLKSQLWNDLGTPLPVDKKLPTPSILFTKLDDKEKKDFRERFGNKNSNASEKPAGIMDLRVALIEEVLPHPDAEKLYVLKLDVGEKRTLVAGLKHHYTPKELTGKKIVIVANLAHAKLRGVVSQGMLLAGEHKGIVRILEPPKQAHPGDAVYPEGNNSTPSKKIAIDVVGQAALTVKEGKAFQQESLLVTEHGPVTVDLQKGGIR